MTTAARSRFSPVQVLGTLAAVTLVGVLGVAGTTAALSATTDNSLNQFDAGEIDLADNDAGSFLYDVDNQEPGDTVERCVKVSYTGTAGSTVALYLGTPVGSVGPYVSMTVEAGTQTGTPVYPDCTGFVSAQSLYSGTLTGFRTDHGSVGTGVVYSPNGVGELWADNDTVVYKVRLELSSTPRGPGENFSGPHTYTWRADTA
ncbi:SipW-cognate class signal peptide [Blastococcus aggregatus]|uniref:SipW-cognate class signal peptide n=1 Tax=Blastococcus aggregatus TaxID=38502 RepID=A0A285V8P9_9ACTN|nr:TasA family protein [Blastococcus aggregatus]SOC50450.1 SipW-cognate class signal peptide [Blastococcus aggregatus]